MGFFSALFGKRNNEEVAKMIKEGAFIVDVRTTAEFSFASAKGSVNIPLNNLRNQLDKFKNKKSIVLCCASGARSGQAEHILKQNGFENVVNAGSWKSVQKALVKV